MRYEKDAIWSNIKNNAELSEEYIPNYDEYRESLRQILPKGFMKIYGERSFHDFKILDVAFQDQGVKDKKVSILILDQHGKDEGIYEIVYRGVKKISCSISIEYSVEWSNDSFIQFDDGLIGHRIVCSDHNIIEVVFKTVGIKRVKNTGAN